MYVYIYIWIYKDINVYISIFIYIYIYIYVYVYIYIYMYPHDYFIFQINSYFLIYFLIKGTCVLTHQIKVRESTLGKKQKEIVQYINDRAERSQQEDRESRRRSNNNITVNEERAHQIATNAVDNESDIENLDVEVIDHIANACRALQRKLQILNNMNDGQALTEICPAQSLLILMDPLLEYPDTVHVQGQRAHDVIPLIMKLLEAASYDTRQHRSRKRKYGIYNGNNNNDVNNPIDEVDAEVENGAQEENFEQNGEV
jgi:cation transport regulator ChaB